MENTLESTNEEEAESSMVVQCIYRQGLDTFAKDDTGSSINV